MIVWNGRGGVVAAIAFGCLLGSEILSESYFHDDTYYQQHGWPKLAGFLVAAGLGWWLQHSSEHDGILSVDQATPLRKPPFLRRSDGLFFIPVRLWPAILCVLGVIFFFTDFS